MNPSEHVKNYLNSHTVPYEMIHHRRDFTAQEAAADTHTKGTDFAKSVILWVENRYCMAVLPASKQIDLAKVKKFLHVKSAEIASEDEVEAICTHCEIGAMPPFGEFYDIPVYVSTDLTYEHLITFNAGTHEDVVRMRYRDYDELVKPKAFDFTLK